MEPLTEGKKTGTFFFSCTEGRCNFYRYYKGNILTTIVSKMGKNFMSVSKKLDSKQEGRVKHLLVTKRNLNFLKTFAHFCFCNLFTYCRANFTNLLKFYKIYKIIQYNNCNKFLSFPFLLSLRPSKIKLI